MNAQNAVSNEIAGNAKSGKPGSSSDCEVVIIGTGPYGLSAASHLKKSGMNVRIFGKPMDFWSNKMPAGMLLRSPRVASNLSDPGHHYSLEAYDPPPEFPRGLRFR